MSKTQIKVPVIESPKPGPYDFEFENPVRQDSILINELLPYSKSKEEFKITQEKNYNFLSGSAKVSHNWLYCGENDFFTVTIRD
ncbi:hypothetical protein [Spiroplasma endosymbiont of Diplazon laetatorius]|uniref:hypothetical protein n=1 Tax=Spiroplasma endosymbiont of Diplazon laetatorius TaxID=3066322 RepID=UPI0030D02C6B